MYIYNLLVLTHSGVGAFMIQNTHNSLCLEDSTATGEVLLRKCNLDSMNQQWVWTTQGKLMCAATSRCLSAQSDPVRTLSCHVPESEGLLWDCVGGRLSSRGTTMMLSMDGRHVRLTDNSKLSKWRSLDQGDICQEKQSKKQTERSHHNDSLVVELLFSQVLNVLMLILLCFVAI